MWRDGTHCGTPGKGGLNKGATAQLWMVPYISLSRRVHDIHGTIVYLRTFTVPSKSTIHVYIFIYIQVNIPHMDPMGMFFYFKIIGDSTHLSTSKHVAGKTCSGYFLKLFLGFDFSLLGGVSIHSSSPWFFGTIFRWTSQTASLSPETRPFDPNIIFQSIDFQEPFAVQPFAVPFGEVIMLSYLVIFCWWFRNPAISTWEV